MLTFPPLRRSLQGAVLLLTSIVVLLLSTYHDGYIRWSASIETAPGLIVSTSTIKGTPLPLGHQEHTINISSSLNQSSLLRRAQAPPGYDRFVCEGDQYLSKIKAAFEGKSPGKEFSPNELANGWTKRDAYDATTYKSIERRWKAVFEDLFGPTKGYPPESEIKAVDLIQDQPYTTFLGRRLDKPTRAWSYGIYYPSRNLMLSQSSLSVVTQIQDRNPGITKEDRDRLLPTISSLSDLMWLAWNTVSSSPKELRYIARDTIFNEDSLAVMDYLFLRDKKDNRAVPWPGLEYKGDSDEGKALLATPNGRSTAWLLIDHAQEMRWKGEITQRQLKVNIFSVAGDYCMLWDMEPQSPRKRSWLGDKLRRHVGRYLRGSIYNKRKVGLAYNETSAQSSYPAHVKHHNKPTLPKPQAFNDSLVKRDPAAEFETAKCTGQRMWAKIQSAFDGHGDPVQSFLPSALNNGWTRGDEKMALDSTWRRYFDRQLGQGKVPPADQVSFVRLVQDRDFVNSQGKSVKAYSGMGAGTALYVAYYVPSISAVVVRNMVSPANVVKTMFTEMGEQLPSNLDIAKYYAPPLSRWSDVTWTVYEDISKNQKNLRYIGHDNIINPATARVMTYIIGRHRQSPSDALSAPFPGLEFGIDTPEGQALLGTQNGLGIGWLLHDRSRELGRRNLKVSIWSEGPWLNMAWDMAPV